MSPDTYPAITPLDIVPYIIFAVPWFMAVFEIRNALKYGQMTEYLRRGSGPESNDERSTRVCRKEDEPWSYWFLFRFYVLIFIGVPVLMVISILNKLGFLG